MLLLQEQVLRIAREVAGLSWQEADYLRRGMSKFKLRVALQTREITDLIACGALDGLGESRAALLAEADQIARAGSARQMAFDFAAGTAVVPETARQRL